MSQLYSSKVDFLLLLLKNDAKQDNNLMLYSNKMNSVYCNCLKLLYTIYMFTLYS